MFCLIGNSLRTRVCFLSLPTPQGCGSSAPGAVEVRGQCCGAPVRLVTGVGLVPFLTTGFQGMSAETAAVSGLHHVDYYLGPLASFLPRVSFMFYRKH